MYLHCGYKFNRFGEEIDAPGGGISEGDFNQKVREIALVCETAFNNLADKITAIENIGKLYSVTNSYFSTKGRRIVSVKPGVDKSDVVIMDQLNEVHDKVKKLMKGIEVTGDCIKIRGNRRICGVTRAKETYDVVTEIQRAELNNKLVEFQGKISGVLTKIETDISELKK